MAMNYSKAKTALKSNLAIGALAICVFTAPATYPQEAIEEAEP